MAAQGKPGKRGKKAPKAKKPEGSGNYGPVVEKALGMASDEGLTAELLEDIKQRYGGVGFLLNALSQRPATFNPYVLKGISVYRQPKALDAKTADLVAVAASTALRCEHCLEAHMGRASAAGASEEEILDAILISSAICESSTLSVAMRKHKQFTDKLKRKGKTPKK